MGQGDLIKEVLPESEFADQDEPKVVRRQRRPVHNGGSQRLRPLPRARGELDLLDLRDPALTFDDLVVQDDVLHLFAEVHLELLKQDFLVAHGVAPRRTFLFTGPPGCGKSATAEALADELGRQFATVNLATVVSSFLGDTAKNLSAIFEAAVAEPWVILFDEFDAIGKERADRTDHGELKRVVTAFLQRIDRFVGPSVLVAATNHPDLLDLAVWRRFDEVLQFDPPSVHEIRALLRHKLRAIDRAQNLDVDALAGACKGFTHADISQVVLSAYRSHLLRTPIEPLSFDELMASANHVRSKLDASQRAG